MSLTKPKQSQTPLAPPSVRLELAALGAFASGSLLSLCFPPVDWTFLAWVALVPLGMALTCERITRQIWAGVYLGGLAFYLMGLDWVRTSYGSDGFDGPYLAGWLLAGQCGAILFMLMVWAGRRFVRRTQLPLSWALPIIWVSFEFVRQIVVAILDRTGAPWLKLGTTQVELTHLAQVADLGGTYLLSFLVVCVNGMIFDLGRWGASWGRSASARWNVAAVVSVPCLILSALAYGHWRIVEAKLIDGPTICLMGKMDLPPLLQEDRIWSKAPATTSAESDADRPDLLVWWELAYHHKLLTLAAGTPASAAHSLPDDVRRLTGGEGLAYGSLVRHYLTDAARQVKAGVLIGCERVHLAGQDVERFNCLAYADPTRGFEGWYDKRYLVPWTEFIPFESIWLTMPGQRDYRHGQSGNTFVLRSADGNHAYRFGCALCYDVAFAGHFRELTGRASPDFFVQCGSERWDETGSLSITLLRMAQLRAIENRRAIVRNVYHGHSGVIDSNGRIVRRTSRQEIDTPLNVGAVPLDSRVSLYAWWGDWMPTLAALAVVICVLAPPRKADGQPAF